MKRLIRALGLLVAGCLVMSIASQLYFGSRESAATRRLAASLEQDLFQPEELRADVACYRDLYRRVHPTAISSFPLADVDGELARLEERIATSMTRLEFYRALAPIISAIGDEHTAIQMPQVELAAHRQAGGRLFPYAVEILQGRLYIVDPEAAGSGIPLGTEITTINRVPATELVTTLKGLFSGTGDAQQEFFVAQSFADAMFLAYGFGEQLSLEVVDPLSGDTASLSVAGKLRSVPRSEDGSGVINQSPLELAQDSSYDVLPSGDVLFRFNAFEDPDGRLTALLDEIFAYLNGAPNRNLVIDVRRNPGGDTRIAGDVIGRFFDRPYSTMSHSDLRVSPELKSYFMSFVPAAIRWLPIPYLHPWTQPLWLGDEGEEVRIEFDEVTPEGPQPVYRGEIVALSGPGAYSSSAIFLATLKTYGMATLVGTPSGGYPTHYGNATPHRLPHTGLLVSMPASTNYGHGTGPVEPHHLVTPTLDDLRTGRDRQLEFALAMLAEDHQSASSNATTLPGS